MVSFSIILSVMLLSCSEEKVEMPTQAGIFYSVVERQAAFSALTINADSYLWDFGDGITSTEQNPVHVYENGGYYTAILTVQGGTGTASDTVDLAVDLTPYILLTGGPTAENGKTWKLDAAHSPYDYFGNADQDLSAVLGPPLPQGAFGLVLGLGEVYDDEYTFHFDGGYEHNLQEDGGAFSGLVYQIATTGGAGIIKFTEASMEYGLCTGKYEPEAGASFTYTENTDLTVSSVYGPGGQLTYSDVNTFEFSGTEFIGFMNFERRAIVQEITDSSMRLVLFAALAQDPPEIIGINTHVLVLTFKTVD